MSEEEYIRNRLDMINRNSHYGLMIDTEISKIVRDHIKRLEETKMNATSTENFKDIIAIDFELQTFPNQDEQDKFIVSATNRDDIFEFVFEGPHIADACRKAGLLNGLEKDQKIRGLEEKIKQLERDNMFDKETADYWSNEYNTLSETLSKLQVEKDQKILEKNKEIDKLKNRILELEKLKTPTIENFVDEEPSSRAGILDRAKRCVCGQREQDYGTPESNFQLIADLWNDYLGITSYVLELEEYLMDLKDKGIAIEINVPEHKAISPEDVSMMMALMKIARIRNGGGSGDSFVDLAGYAACGGEIWYGGKA